MCIWDNLISIAGFFCFAFIAWSLSVARDKIKWQPVLGGIILQFIFALIVFGVPGSRDAFVLFSNLFAKIIGYSREGIIFVFGYLGAESSPQNFILAFQALPFIVIFSSLMALLYHLKVMPLIIRMFAYLFSKTMKTSGAESLCTASNIFVGIESVTTIRPYLAKMTRSELFTILVAGMATIASSVLAVYVSILEHQFPLIAGHLMSASLLSAPATFVISKLMIPETEFPETLRFHSCKLVEDTPSSNIIESIINGAINGAKLTGGVVITLIAFVGLLGIVEGSMGHLSRLAGFDVSLKNLLAYVFYPFVWLMGIPSNEIREIAKMLGERLILTEIPAYIDLAKFAANGGSQRSLLIASYALCGFTHVASMAIFVGGIGILAPNQMPALARLGPRALLAATIVTMMTGSVAGFFYCGQSGILQ